MITLEILGTGPLAVVQDLGRTGLAHLGVGRSGAADRRSHTLANRLVANPDDRATVEVTFGGFSARVHGGDVDIAVTGADTNPSVNGKMFGTNSIRHVRDGQVISLGAPRAGLAVKPFEPAFYNDFALLYPASKPMSRVAEAFTQAAMAALRDYLE